jgi:hypothetical protein
LLDPFRAAPIEDAVMQDYVHRIEELSAEIAQLDDRIAQLDLEIAALDNLIGSQQPTRCDRCVE